jgi:hypothetical protein
MWIATYFKEVFCGTIQSTQRSESVNNSKSVHEFAKCFLDVLVLIHDNEAREKYYSQVWFPVYPYPAFKSNDLVFDIK